MSSPHFTQTWRRHQAVARKTCQKLYLYLLFFSKAPHLSHRLWHFKYLLHGKFHHAYKFLRTTIIWRDCLKPLEMQSYFFYSFTAQHYDNAIQSPNPHHNRRGMSYWERPHKKHWCVAVKGAVVFFPVIGNVAAAEGVLGKTRAAADGTLKETHMNWRGTDILHLAGFLSSDASRQTILLLPQGLDFCSKAKHKLYTKVPCQHGIANRRGTNSPWKESGGKFVLCMTCQY